MFDHPLHPIAVHFPIALLSTAVFLDLLGLLLKRPNLRQSAFHLLALGIISGAVASILGVLHEETVEAAGVPEEAIEDHEKFAFITLGVFSVLFLLRWWFRMQWDSLRNRMIYFAISIAGIVLLGITGFEGGELVYKHGAGVASSATTSAPPPAHEGGEP